MSMALHSTQLTIDEINDFGNSPTLALRQGDSIALNPSQCTYLDMGAFGKTFRIDGWLTESYRSPFLSDDEFAQSTHPQACCLKLFNVHSDAERQEVAHRVEMEYEWLRIANGAGAHTPRPLALAHGVDDESDFFGIAMEYLPTRQDDLPAGRTWRTLQSKRDVRLDITNGADRLLTPTETAHSVLSLCHAIQAVHAAGLVHRDIKPNNVAAHVGPCKHDQEQANGQPIRVIDKFVLLDLGQATLPDATVTVLHDTHSPRFASALYGAPEIFDIDPAGPDGSYRYGPFWKYRNEPAVDIYAIGCLTYYLYTMRDPDFPLTADADSLRSRAMQAKRAGLQLARRSNLDAKERAIEDVLCDLVERCTVYDPRKRAAIARLDRLISSLEACLGLSPLGQSAQTMLGLSLATGDMGDWQDDYGRSSTPSTVEAGVQTAPIAGYGEHEADSLESLGERNTAQDSSQFDKVVQDYQRALVLLNNQPAETAQVLRPIAVVNNYEPAWVLLGQLFAQGKANAQDASEFERALRTAGKSGNAQAWYRLGLAYRNGTDGMGKSEPSALQCFGQAVDLGHGGSAVELGTQLFEQAKKTASSVDAKRYLGEAYRLFSAAVRLGDNRGWVGMGYVCEQPSFADSDLAKANYCYQEVLKQQSYETQQLVAWGLGRTGRAKKRFWYIALLVPLFVGMCLMTIAVSNRTAMPNAKLIINPAECILLYGPLAVPTFLVPSGLLFQRHGRQRNGMLELVISTGAFALAAFGYTMLASRSQALHGVVFALVFGLVWFALLLCIRTFATRDHWIVSKKSS